VAGCPIHARHLRRILDVVAVESRDQRVLGTRPAPVSAETLELAFEVGSVFADRAGAPMPSGLQRAAAVELGGTPCVRLERDSSAPGADDRGRAVAAERDEARARATLGGARPPAVTPPSRCSALASRRSPSDG
jgi:hypothetical protein